MLLPILKVCSGAEFAIPTLAVVIKATSAFWNRTVFEVALPTLTTVSKLGGGGTVKVFETISVILPSEFTVIIGKSIDCELFVLPKVPAAAPVKEINCDALPE